MTLSIGIFLAVAIVLLVLGVNFATSLGISSIVYLLLEGIPLTTVVQRMFAGCDVVALLCIPFFILAGDLMAKGGIAKRLVAVCNMIVGGVHGGLAFVTLLVCAVFAAMTGSAMACCVTIGSIMLTYMLASGYDNDFATSVFCAGAVLGPIIPPSTAMVIYAVNANVSLTDLYLLGVPAGIYMLVALCLVAYVVCKKRGYKGIGRAAMVCEPGERLTFQKALLAVIKAIPALGSPAIILGSIYAGIATPTEAAVIAVLYSFIVGKFVYREIKFRDIPQLLKRSAISTANVMYIVASAGLFAWVVSRAGIPTMVVNGLLGISDNPNVIMLLIILILLVLGCFMEATPILLITIPMFLPVINSLGLSATHFGIIMTITVCIGFVTPPFGTVLFTGMTVSGSKMHRLAKNVLPFIAVMIVMDLLVAFFPAITTWILGK
ncbi:MAG: TRAP transporter large permease [Parasporobacterium sp.]|nr:TRAP transporter large permease [Parasporobacterium sp.]